MHEDVFVKRLGNARNGQKTRGSPIAGTGATKHKGATQKCDFESNEHLTNIDPL